MFWGCILPIFVIIKYVYFACSICWANWQRCTNIMPLDSASLLYFLIPYLKWQQHGGFANFCGWPLNAKTRNVFRSGLCRTSNGNRQLLRICIQLWIFLEITDGPLELGIFNFMPWLYTALYQYIMYETFRMLVTTNLATVRNV